MSVLYVKSSEGFPLLNLKIKSNPLFRAYPTISYLCLLFQLSTLSSSTLFTFLQLYWLSLHLSNITTLFQLISILGPLWQKYFGLFAWHALSSYFCSHVLSLIYFCHSGHNSNILFSENSSQITLITVPSKLDSSISHIFILSCLDHLTLPKIIWFIYTYLFFSFFPYCTHWSSVPSIKI